MKPFLWLLPTFSIALALDGLTKAWAEQTLLLNQAVPVIGAMFRLTLGYNAGVAFGLFANGGVLPPVATGMIIVGLTVWLVGELRGGGFPSVAGLPVGLILGGAIANFADRLPDGRVTDFVDVGLGASRWPTFNMADSFIVLGVVFLMLIITKRKTSTVPLDK
ncbi:MAG: signal peptidase II [Chloroflexi bacterium]|nr:signal peptidase II [Chloroflexota bacterium]